MEANRELAGVGEGVGEGSFCITAFTPAPPPSTTLVIFGLRSVGRVVVVGGGEGPGTLWRGNKNMPKSSSVRPFFFPLYEDDFLVDFYFFLALSRDSSSSLFFNPPGPAVPC